MRSISTLQNDFHRLMYFNLYNSTGEAGMADHISLYDGDIYNVTSTKLADIISGKDTGRQFHTTLTTNLSVKLHASGGSGNLGFLAEVVTIPLSAVGFSECNLRFVLISCSS
jgi:hypothetical protein